MNILSEITSFLSSNGYTSSYEEKKKVPKNYPLDTIHTASTQDVVGDTGRKLREWIYPQETREVAYVSLFQQQEGKTEKNIQFEFFPELYKEKIQPIHLEKISETIKNICQFQYVFPFQSVLEIYEDFLVYLHKKEYSIQKYFFRDQLSGAFPEIGPEMYTDMQKLAQDLYGEGISDFVLVLHCVHENGNHFCCELHTEENSF